MTLQINDTSKIGQFFAAIEAEAKAFGREMRHTAGHLRAIRRGEGDTIIVPDAVASVAQSAAKAVGL